MRWFSVIMKWGEVGNDGEFVRWVGKEGEKNLKVGELLVIYRWGHRNNSLGRDKG